MLEDKLLVWRFKHGNRESLRRIYEKYKNDLLALAITLLNDRAAAEDVLHDVFVSFAEVAEKLELRSSLRGYLSACVANRVRNLHRSKPPAAVRVDEATMTGPSADNPAASAMSAEESRRISEALEMLAYEQREAIILHVLSGLKFKAIAEAQGVSLNTILSRYRYGLDRLRSMLNSEAKNESCSKHRTVNQKVL